jgi:hypothetical protein
VVRRSILIPAAAVFAVVLCAWWVLSPFDGARTDAVAKLRVAPADVAPAAKAPAVDLAVSDRPMSVAGVPGLPAASETPPGLTGAQWAAVEASLRGRPEAAAERQRLWAYFSWQDAVRRWRADPAGPALAAAVRAGLSERLARREVSAAEARQLEATLLGALEPDPARREAALQAFDAARPGAEPPDARTLAFQRAQAAAVAAWSATPAAQRDPAALKSELERLRRQHFAQAAPTIPLEATR